MPRSTTPSFLLPISPLRSTSPFTRPSITTAHRNLPTAKMVRVSVPLTIEAPPKFCHTVFSDLSQMPSWSTTLQSVKRDPQEPLYSDWTFSWNGITLSWRAIDESSPPLSIRWRSVTGLTHTGQVTFSPLREDNSTTMTMTVDYDINSLLAVVMQSALVANFVQSAIESDLSRFRSFTLRQKRKQKISSSSSAKHS